MDADVDGSTAAEAMCPSTVSPCAPAPPSGAELGCCAPSPPPVVRRIAAARSGLLKPPATVGGLLSASVPQRQPRSVPPKPGPLNLGLNASSCSQAQSLPARRRGTVSYQSLKRASPSADTSADDITTTTKSRCATNSCCNISEKKQTHWEAYGTVMVLFTIFDSSAETETAMQMLSAEGYDAEVATSSEQTLSLFDAQSVHPDIVLIDSDHRDKDCKRLIQQLFRRNPTVAIIVLGGATSTSLSAVAALQGGAADFMHKPLDMDELVARVERHVQRQHCIKLDLETALDDARKTMAKMSPFCRPSLASPVVDAVSLGINGDTTDLTVVAETDFEEQMSDLSEENQRLVARVQELERQLQERDAC